jgi:uncharacterized protein (DUF2141 family)
MLKYFIRPLAAIILCLCMTTTSNAQLSLSVEVGNISHSKGKILLALFNRSAGFPENSKNAFAVKEIPAIKGKATVKFEGLAPGTYAVAVFHDANSDGKLNTNLLGIPKEDYGFSNNARPGFRAPTFEEAAFKIYQSSTIFIQVK